MYAEVQRQVDAIEAEMKRIGYWQAAPPTAEAMRFKDAFGLDRLPYSQWLQFVLIPRVRRIIETRGAFPRGSNTAGQAIREFDGHDEAQPLVNLLVEFDELFSHQPLLGMPGWPRVAPKTHGMVVAAAAAAWVLASFFAIFNVTRYLNQNYFPRDVACTLQFERPSTGLTAQFFLKAFAGAPTASASELRSVDVTLSRHPPHAMSTSAPGSASAPATQGRDERLARFRRDATMPLRTVQRRLVAGSPNPSETAIASFDRETAADWLEELAGEEYAIDPAARAADAEALASLIGSLRSARSQDELLKLTVPPPGWAKGQFDGRVNTYARFIPEWGRASLAAAVALIGVFLLPRVLRGLRSRYLLSRPLESPVSRIH